MTDRSAEKQPCRVVAVIAALAVAVLLWPLTSLTSSPAGSSAFPNRLETYSWWTPMLGSGQIGRAAMIYQNGFGVELGDFPQSVILAADGSTYRRLGAAEARSVAADQGDPADALLAADGRSVVISGPGRESTVEVLDLATMTSRAVPIGEGRSAIAVSIDSSDDRVLLLTSEADMSRYTDMSFRLNGMLTILDLTTGATSDLPLDSDVHSAAVSPDGTRIAAQTDDAVLIIDADDGRVMHELEALRGELDGDAWSPGGTRLAAVHDGALRVVDLSRDQASEVLLPLPADSYSRVIGWRDERTALTHHSASDGSNDSSFAWMETEDGRAETFAEYSADPLTGAALGGADVARDLVPELEILPSRGSNPIGPETVLVFSVIVGLVVRSMMIVRSRTRLM